MVDWQKFEKVLHTIRITRLTDAYDRQASEAEDAWSENLKALKLIDLKNDGVNGEYALEALQDALANWIDELEDMTNAAKTISKRATAAIHSGASAVELEVDSSGERGASSQLQGVRLSRKKRELKTANGRRSGRHSGGCCSDCRTNAGGRKEERENSKENTCSR